MAAKRLYPDIDYIKKVTKRDYMTDIESARGVAYRFIGYAARSRSEMEKRLEREEFAPDVIAAVIAECEAAGWIDDAKFANDWIADRADRKKFGKTRLKMELQRKGIDKDTVSEALDKMDDDAELLRARGAAQAKWKPDVFALLDRNEKQAEKQKLANFLMRRGFAWSTIKQVLAELMANE